MLSKIVDAIKAHFGYDDAVETTAPQGYGFAVALRQTPALGRTDALTYVPLSYQVGIQDLGGFVPLNYVPADGNLIYQDLSPRVVRKDAIGRVDERGLRLIGALPVEGN